MKHLSLVLQGMLREVEGAENAGTDLVFHSGMIPFLAPAWREMVARAQALEAAEAERDALRAMVEALTAAHAAKTAADTSIPIRRGEPDALSNITPFPAERRRDRPAGDDVVA